ncbi:multicopper oxidase family protein [Pilimelia columellifera]|uniref:Multicopper oxidase family protein n=1 Tax=Pilimelia columellifera subsp. columellifera TaxID=706583 RepID=A0ABN3N696_9ACTN
MSEQTPGTHGVNRRDLMRRAGAAGALVATGLALPLGRSVQTSSVSLLPSNKMPKPFKAPFRRPPVLKPRAVTRDARGFYTQHYTVNERLGATEIAPGIQTPVYGYNGIFPGPTIEVNRGVKTVVRVRNKLPNLHPDLGHSFATSTHLHGSASAPQYDGYANDITPPGFYKDYHYPNFQPARTLWYHDHGVHHTAENAYSGLAGMYIIRDAAERALLPQGEFDVPLVINDVMLGADGRLAYDDNDHSGLWGDIILVNGVPWPKMKVKRRVYRFRVLNCSIARSYRFRLSTGDPVTMVATDGGLMPVARRVDQWRHGGAERYEILIDFRRYKPGQRIELRNLSNDNNRDYSNTNRVMQFEVTDDAFSTVNNRIPTTLVPSAATSLKPSQAKRSRYLRVHRSNSEWKINDQSWHDVVASGYTSVVSSPEINEVEIWDIENTSGGWFHPVHIHLVDFQIIGRNGRPPFDYERGPKDVVYVGEGERVRLLMQFAHQRGKYMIHCHNLPHEDHDMMLQFSVGLKPGAIDPNDPIKAAPPRRDTLPPNA